MSKVLVDRALLENVCDVVDSLECASGFALGSCEELRELLAQPAEAEGAIQCPASQPAECYAAGTQVVHASLVHGIVRKADELQAALSSVTAERDRLDAECGRLLEGKIQDAETIYVLEAERDQLRAEVESLRVALLGIAQVNPAERGIEWAKAYASDGLKGAGSELYARWLDAFKEAETLRKDAERYRMFRRGMFDPDRFDADIDAMAAKEV